MKQTGTRILSMSSRARSLAARWTVHVNRGRFSACVNAMWRWMVNGFSRGAIILKSATGEISSSEETGRSCRATVEMAMAPPYENPITVSAEIVAVCARTSSATAATSRSEEHTSELQSQSNLVCRLLLEKKKKNQHTRHEHAA